MNIIKKHIILSNPLLGQFVTFMSNHPERDKKSYWELLHEFCGDAIVYTSVGQRSKNHYILYRKESKV